MRQRVKKMSWNDVTSYSGICTTECNKIHNNNNNNRPNNNNNKIIVNTAFSVIIF